MKAEIFALTIPAAVKTSGLGRTTLYGLIGSGQIDARKAGGRTLILADSLHRYLAGLPVAVIRTGRARIGAAA